MDCRDHPILGSGNWDLPEINKATATVSGIGEWVFRNIALSEGMRVCSQLWTKTTTSLETNAFYKQQGDGYYNRVKTSSGGYHPYLTLEFSQIKE